MFPLFIYYVSGHCLSESSLKLILASVFMTGFKKQKEHILHKWDFTVLLKQNNFCIMNKIKLVWFYSLYKKFFLSKNAIFLYNLKIFFDMLHLKILLESWIVCIFSMCVKAIHTWYVSGMSQRHRFFCSCKCVKVLFTGTFLKCRFR